MHTCLYETFLWLNKLDCNALRLVCVTLDAMQHVQNMLLSPPPNSYYKEESVERRRRRLAGGIDPASSSSSSAVALIIAKDCSGIDVTAQGQPKLTPVIYL